MGQQQPATGVEYIVEYERPSSNLRKQRVPYTEQRAAEDASQFWTRVGATCTIIRREFTDTIITPEQP